MADQVENSTFASRAAQRGSTKQVKRASVETKVVESEDTDVKADDKPARSSRSRKG